MGDLSLHFSRYEFRCLDAAETPVPATLDTNLHRLIFGILEPVRAEVRVPVIVLSGFRTDAHNMLVGGAPDSRHLHADAADIYAPLYDRGDTKLWVLIRFLWARGYLANLGGLGRYRNRVHVDARPHEPGVLAEWDNKHTGARG